jgi:tetratricopeptide (TPR) repeat protein
MKKSALYLIWMTLLVAVVVATALPLHADQDAQLFQDAVALYQAGNYTDAAEAFEKIAHDGIRNGKLYYNIGNARLKEGRLGPAILWYERASTLVPEDPDLRFNLEYARSLLKDEPADISSPVLQVLFFWKDLLGISAWHWVAIVSGLAFWCLWAAARLLGKPVLKPFIYGFLGLTLLSTGTALYRTYSARVHPRAVILEQTVSVRSGFSADTTELFVLHEGTRVAVEKQSGDYLKIRYADDKIGWVSTDMAEII